MNYFCGFKTLVWLLHHQLRDAWPSKRSIIDVFALSRTVILMFGLVIGSMPYGASATVPGISSTAYHNCSVTNGGAVQCWGRNDSGQLGNGTTTTTSTPVAVSGLSSGVSAVTVGSDQSGSGHSCALTTGGAVKCWGSNNSRQLGNGGTTNSSTPVPVSGLSSGVVALSAAGGRTCALTSAGAVKCWGNSQALATVNDLSSGVTEVSVGLYNLCAVKASGEIICKGTNSAVINIPGRAASVSVGTPHACAVNVSGSVYCWGGNRAGQLGNSSQTDSVTPVQVSNLSGVAIRVAAGSVVGGGNESHTCALLAAGNVQCWGSNYLGQLGNGNGDSSPSTVPVNVTGLAGGVVSLSAGPGHTCAVGNTGGVQCWGYNGYGELGNGSPYTSSAAVPVRVSGISGGAVDIRANRFQTCVQNGVGAVQCWGFNGSGQRGNNSGPDGYPHPTPSGVLGLSGSVAKLAVGLDHDCALNSAGTVQCWGSNASGELGTGSVGGVSTSPLAVAGLSGVTGISAGSGRSCAVTSGGAIYCWGSNTNGTLGNGGSTDSALPVLVSGFGSGGAAVSVGYSHTCAVTTLGGVKCWGYAESGELGNGNSGASSTPVDVVGLSNGVKSVAAASGFSCALMNAGAVKCWGSNNFGQLGNGTTANSAVPVAVAGLSNGVTALAATTSHVCALTSTGIVKCWGSNSFGQLGDGTLTQASTPVSVAGLESSVSAIATGDNHSCARQSNGSVVCWGGDQFWYGLIGNGLSKNQWEATPALISSLNLGVTTGADLSVTMTAETVGDLITYRLAAINLGPNVATNATLSVQLPSAVTFLGASPAGCTLTNSVLNCPLGNLPAGGSVSYVVQAKLATPTEDVPALTATASISSGSGDPYPANSTVTATTPPIVIASNADVPTLPEWGAIMLGGLLLLRVARRNSSAPTTPA